MREKIDFATRDAGHLDIHRQKIELGSVSPITIQKLTQNGS